MEAIVVSWVFALSDTHERLDLVHLGDKLLVAAVNELKLALLADEFLLSSLLFEVPAEDSCGGGARR